MSASTLPALMACRVLFVAGLFVASNGAGAQEAAPAGMSLAQSAGRRFAQPVRVGDLLMRQVLQPLESQPTLGWVRSVVRGADGRIQVVIDFGGFLGLFTHPIAVPVDAMALLGQVVEVIDFTPAQLGMFPVFDGTSLPLPPDEVIKIGLARPSH